MEQIITAIGKDKINEQLKKEKFPIIKQDIQNQKELLNIIEKNKNINLLIISENIPGDFEIKKLINKIKIINKKIKIIIILENKNIELENYLKNNNINNILYNNKSTVLEIKNIIKEKNNFNNNKIITIAGASNKNKNIFSYFLAMFLKKENNKIIIIDLDIFNNNINNFFKIKNNQNKLINKINNNIDILNIKHLLRKTKMIEKEFNSIFEKIKINYDYIIINTSSECFYKITKKIINISNYIIAFIESEITEIKKANTLLKIYTKNWNINKEKINIVYNQNSIYLKITTKIFDKFKVLETVKINENYEKTINKKDYFKIIKDIEKGY